MKPVIHLVLPALLLATFSHAQTPAPAPAAEKEPPEVLLTPAQTAHILKELEKVEEQIGQGRGAVFSAALAKFRPAMASDSAALSLYLECYKLENFERRNLKQTDFMEWRDRNEPRLKDSANMRALSLQLEYLVLSIQAQGVEDISKMGGAVAALQAFMARAINEVQATMKHTASGAVEVKDTSKATAGAQRRPGGGGGQGGGSPLEGILRQSVKNSVFGQAYKLGDYLSRRDWEYVPLNIDGIYSSVIFPYFLSEKKEELAAQWDARINAELALRKAGLSETEFNLYAQEKQPQLLWAKNNYLLSNNINPVVALADMLKVIQANPNHPDAAGWLKQFKDIVRKVSYAEPAAPPAETPVGSQ